MSESNLTTFHGLPGISDTVNRSGLGFDNGLLDDLPSMET